MVAYCVCSVQVHNMNLIMREPGFCIICENKDTDQLRSNCAADFATKILQRYFISPKFQASCHLLWLYVSDLVGNPEDRFSHNEALKRHEETLCGLTAQYEQLHVRRLICIYVVWVFMLVFSHCIDMAFCYTASMSFFFIFFRRKSCLKRYF